MQAAGQAARARTHRAHEQHAEKVHCTKRTLLRTRGQARKRSSTRGFQLSLSELVGGRPSLLSLLEGVSQTALAAVLAVEVVGHEDAGAASLVGALTSQAGDLAVAVDLVVLEDSELDLLLLVLDLLGGGVVLLLALLSCKASHKNDDHEYTSEASKIRHRHRRCSSPRAHGCSKQRWLAMVQSMAEGCTYHHHAGGARGGGWTPSGCCSQKECGRPRAACRRRSDAVDQGGYLQGRGQKGARWVSDYP